MESKNNNGNGGQRSNMTFSSPPEGGLDSSTNAVRPSENQTTQEAASSSESRNNNDIISMALSAIQMMPALNNKGLDLSGNNMSSGNMFQQLQQIGFAAMQQAENVRKNAPSAAASSQQMNSSDASAMQQKESPTVENSAAVQQSSDSSKTPSKRSKRTIVVPCRARGMSIEHNFQTAYFEIPHNIKHGDGLICSFPACRNRGVKFLYCAFCQDPVAKRNFRNRHSHGQNVDKDGKFPGDKKERGESDRNMKSRRIENSEESKIQAPPVATVISNSLGSSTDKKQEAGIKRHASCIVTSADDMTKGKMAKHDPRKDAWDYLFRSRPVNEDSDGMSAWLMQVMSVSDPTNLAGVNSVMRQIPQVKESLGANSGSTSTSTELDGTVNCSTSSITSSRNGRTDSSSSFITGTRNGTTDSSSTPTDGSSNDGDSNEEPSSSSNGSTQNNLSNDSSSSDNQENTGDSSSN